MRRIWDRGVLVACAAISRTFLSDRARRYGSELSGRGAPALQHRAIPWSTPGANLILVDYNKVPKPSQDGYLVRMAPNLRYAKVQRELLRQDPDRSL